MLSKSGGKSALLLLENFSPTQIELEPFLWAEKVRAVVCGRLCTGACQSALNGTRLSADVIYPLPWAAVNAAL